MILTELLLEIKSLADPQKAVAAQAYHKSAREHWGVTMPQVETLAKAFSKGLKEDELISLAETLWMTDLFDPMMCATKILSLPRIKPSPLLWYTIKNCLKNVD